MMDNSQPNSSENAERNPDLQPPMDTDNESVGELPLPTALDVSGPNDIAGSLLGVTKQTLDEMYDLYCRHGSLLGFTVRKSTARHSNGVVFEKYFVCSCSGSKPCNKDSQSVRTPKKKVDSPLAHTLKKQARVTRTGCNASLRVKMNKNGLYEVVHHILAHNHPLTKTEGSHLQCSERNISNEKGKANEWMVGSDIRATDSLHYMVHESEGDESIGHSMVAIETGDAQTVIGMLTQQANDEEDFFFRVRLDDNNKPQNLFWRDSMMKEDYMVYGDVVVFDTTYRTNKYNLICAPFVGVNNHGKNVMFACAFLSEEKIESYEWLFEVFKKSMLGKDPVTIFTDQDLAIGCAIGKVFPSTRHRLCLWHLYRNIIRQFGELKRDDSFKVEFNKCLTGDFNEEEFENCWNSMISRYGLEDHAWFKHLYELKDKWCTASRKDFFSFGILPSQREESADFAMGFNATKSTSLTDFYNIFKATVKRWRSNEQHDEFQSKKSLPTSALPMTGLLKHAAEVYTQTIFNDFEAEFMSCISARSVLESMDHHVLVYNVTKDNLSSHRVVFDMADNLVTCSCKKMEECGLLCFHCLRVLHINSVDQIPQQYIVKRWTRFAKSDIWDRLQRGHDQIDDSKECVTWRHEMALQYYNLLLKCQGSDKARRIIEDGYNRDLMAVSALVNSSDSI